MVRDILKEDFNDYICKPFCSYFRENSKEDMACQAALIVVDLVESGQLGRYAVPRLDGTVDFIGCHDPDLDEAVCGQCGFREDGCDFQSTEEWETSEPCGGYKVLSLLKREGNLPLPPLEGDN